MRPILAFLSIASLSLCGELAWAATTKTVDVLGRKFVLMDEKSTAQQYLAEYLPPKETFDDYSKMIAVWGVKNGTDAAGQWKAKIAFVAARKGADPMANYNAFVSDDKKSYGLDFLISEGGIVEQDVWLYKDVPGGVLAYQYARHYYEGKTKTSEEDFIRQCPAVSTQILAFYKKDSLPKPIGY